MDQTSLDDDVPVGFFDRLQNTFITIRSDAFKPHSQQQKIGQVFFDLLVMFSVCEAD